MEYRQLGRSGIKVSAFTLGSMEIGVNVPEEEAIRLFGQAMDAGINAVDTANCYAGGASEEIVGRLIKPHRHRIVLSTKFSVPTASDDANSGGTSRRSVVENCEASLRRLGTDHIDVYYIHRPFQSTPIDETLRALDDLVRSGKVRSIGSSSFAGWQLVEAQWCAREQRLTRPTAEQTPYHLLDRRIERELVPAARSHGVGLTIWSPLAGGLLTGKYLGRPSGDMRLKPDDAAWGAKHHTDGAHRAVKALSQVAQQCCQTLTALSLAWTLSRPGVSSIVLGPRNAHQFSEQLGALDVSITASEAAAIDEIVPPGRVIVPYYLDDAFADFSPNTHHW